MAPEFDLFEPSNPFDLGARINGKEQPTGLAPAWQNGQHLANGQEDAQIRTMEMKPMTMGAYAQKISFQNGQYVEHDGKLYNRRDGKIFQVTGGEHGEREASPEEVSLLSRNSNASMDSPGPRPAPEPRYPHYHPPQEGLKEDNIEE